MEKKFDALLKDGKHIIVYAESIAAAKVAVLEQLASDKVQAEAAAEYSLKVASISEKT